MEPSDDKTSKGAVAGAFFASLITKILIGIFRRVKAKKKTSKPTSETRVK